jgi:uncharacterized delta-60 repeat protein
MNANGGTSVFRVGPESDPDRYVLGVAVGSGAEGILYRGSITTATGVELDVAIKMLQPRFLGRVEEWHSRWSEQIELLHSLHVPGVVPVRDGFLGPLPHTAGQLGEGRTLYLVMNWIEGETLDDWVRHHPDRDPIDDLKMLVPIAAALDLMHSGRATGGVPIVHRDVKPSNVIVTDQDTVLVDFGLTRGLPTGQRLTGVTGTPGYLAPEVNDNGLYSPATDRYAFGAVAYYMITGIEPPTSHQPDVLRTHLAAVPAIGGHPEVVGHLMAMLDTDPDRRPAGLANWVGQLRYSSLQPGPDILNPLAPTRHSTKLPHKINRQRSKRRRTSPSRFAVLAVGVLLAVLAGSGLLAANLLASPAQHHGRNANQLSSDPTCGQGEPVPLSPFPSGVPVAAIVRSSRTIVGAKTPGVPGTGWLMRITPACSLDQTPVQYESVQPAGGPVSLAALTLGSNGDLYTAGSNQAGWQVARYLPNGNIDTSFGSGGSGYVTIPEPSPAFPGGNGTASAISVGKSGEIFVLGADSGPHGGGKTLLVGLRSNGSLDPSFGNQGVVTTDLGYGSGELMTMTTDGHLLLGNNEGGMGCAQFTIEKYRPSGTIENTFTKIVGSGTGSLCIGSITTRIPGYDSANLTTVLPMSDGDIVAVGYASDFYAYLQKSVFLVRYREDGSVEGIFGHDGIVKLPELTMPVSPVYGSLAPVSGAVVQPGGGVVLAITTSAGLSLKSIAPTGAIDGGVQVPNTKPTSVAADPSLVPLAEFSIVVTDAGAGKIFVVVGASGPGGTSGQWHVERYLAAGS